MRILIVTDELPYPVVSGAPLRTYSLLTRVARRHQVWLAAFADRHAEAVAMQHLETICQQVVTADRRPGSALSQPLALFSNLLSGRPPDIRFYDSQELASQIRGLASQVAFDVVQIEHGHMGRYLETLPKRLRSKALWMLHDVDWRKYAAVARIEPRPARKLRVWLHSSMLARWEPRHAARFGCCATVSEGDRKLLLAANSALRVAVVPNGVDASGYRPLPVGDNRPALLFVGNMDYRPNVDAVVSFCSQALPLIRRVVPDLELWIVGANPRPEVRDLQGNGVHVTGRVDDVRPFYARSTACVVPIRAGGGTRLKILEAMALGRPVVSTSAGCEGLEVTPDEHFLLAETPADLARKAVQILTDERLRERISARARELVVRRYDWDIIAEGLLQVYAGLTRDQGTPS